MSDRTIPSHVHSFHLTRVSTAAVTFYFRPDGAHSGWALATVNNDTGELTIQSDWGNWSHRWSAAGMPERDGRRVTLMEFIADRTEDYCDYLADKLTGPEDRNVFSPETTVAELRRLLLANRLEQGRTLIDYYEGEEPEDIPDVGTSDPPRYGVEWRKVRLRWGEEEWPLTKATARDIYDKLGDLDGYRDPRDFVDAFYQINGHEWVGEGIEFEHLCYEPTYHYYQLLHGILPAVVRACAKTVAEREANAPCMAPEEREQRTEVHL